MATVQEIYEDKLDKIKYRPGGEQVDALCPFHKDTKASFTVNIRTGLFKCFNPDCAGFEGGNLKKFLTLLGEKDVDSIIKEATKVDKTILSNEAVKEKHLKLLETKGMLDYLTVHGQFTIETIRRFNLGWDGVRVWIPIYVDKKLVGIRQYNPVLEVKTIGVKGFNQPTLFPYDNIHKDTIYWCAGEKDTILACQLGLNAMTVTGAEGTFPKEVLGKFINKTIYLIHDIDTAGEKAANRYFLIFRKVAKRIIKVTLPVTAPNKDLTEFIVTEGKTIDDLKEAIANGKILHDKSDIVDEVPIETTLSNLRCPDFFDHSIIVEALVTGKDIDPFIVPSSIKAQCNNPGTHKACKQCAIIGEAITIDFANKDLIKFTGVTDKQLLTVALEVALLPKCQNIEIHKSTLVSLYRVQLQTPITSTTQSGEEKPATAQGYVLDHEVEANKIYKCLGILTNEPKTQYATVVISTIKSTNSEIEKFALDEKWMKRLKTAFQIES